jgi:hypothetical protein
MRQRETGTPRTARSEGTEMIDVRDSIRISMEENRLTSADVARACGVDQSSFSRFLNKSPTPAGKERRIRVDQLNSIMSMLGLAIVPKSHVKGDPLQELRQEVELLKRRIANVEIPENHVYGSAGGGRDDLFDLG